MGDIQLTCIFKPVPTVKKHQRITSQSADAFKAGQWIGGSLELTLVMQIKH
jgi:hypothetical protein